MLMSALPESMLDWVVGPGSVLDWVPKSCHWTTVLQIGCTLVCLWSMVWLRGQRRHPTTGPPDEAQASLRRKRAEEQRAISRRWREEAKMDRREINNGAVCDNEGMLVLATKGCRRPDTDDPREA